MSHIQKIPNYPSRRHCKLVDRRKGYCAELQIARASAASDLLRKTKVRTEGCADEPDAVAELPQLVLSR